MNKIVIALIIITQLCNGQLTEILSKVNNYSYSGYKNSDSKIPEQSSLGIINVLQFGAIPDDNLEDGPAIQNAFNYISQGVLYFPKGKYLINQPLILKNKNNITIRGDSNGGTIFYSKSNAMDYGFDQFMSQNGQVGNMVTFISDSENLYLGPTILPSLKNSNQITIKNATKLQPDDTIYITMTEVNEQTVTDTLWQYLHGTNSTIWNNLTMKVDPTLDSYYRVKKIEITENGYVITLKEPLRLDLNLRFQPKIFKYQAKSKNIGIENINFEFIYTTPLPHNQEHGYNSLIFQNVIDFWAINLTFKNIDSGLRVHRAAYGTIQNITFTGRGGHHALLATLSSSIVFHNCQQLVNSWMIHSIGVGSYANNIVFSRISSNTSVFIDGHRKYSFGNLVTEINGKYSWESGGNVEAGPHWARDNTFWGYSLIMTIATSVKDRFTSEFYQYLNNFVSKSIEPQFKQLGQTVSTTLVKEIPDLTINNLFLYQLQQRCPQCVSYYS